MQIKVENLTQAEGALIVIECDHLDAGNAPEFKDAIHPYLEDHKLVIIDMRKLAFLDSSGLGAMLSCLRTMNNKQGVLNLIGLTEPIRALFELVRMHRIFSIYNSLDEALASI